jgi:FMN phosphatase YigB (HAD superfamily)
MKQKLYSAILFDLDDTLIDTTQYLVRPALKAAFARLAERGVLESIQEGLDFHHNHPELSDKPHFFEFLIQKKSEDKNIASADHQGLLDEILGIYFGEPKPEAVKTFPETHEVLSALATDYDLYLVSMGRPSTQERKVEAAGLTHFFTHCWFPDFRTHHNKEVIFRVMLGATRFPPARVLCVGNRIDQEIMNAKSLGMKTCWVEYGEHLDRRPQLHHEIPDFVVPSLRELIHTCHL